MTSGLSDAIEVLSDRLYWAALDQAPKNNSKTHYFSIDNELLYEPFSADFGPLNLGMVYRYCKKLEAKLSDPCLADKRIVHFSASDPKKRTNSATLICAFQVIVLGKSAEKAYEPFVDIYPQFLPFRDALSGVCTFHLTIMDVLKGLEKSIERGWFDYGKFDVVSYEYFEKVENGDMNWIIPEKFLAFAGPSATSTGVDGFPAFTPEECAPMFREAGIGHVIRLNKKQYDRRRFTQHGLHHSDLYFVDGSCPSSEVTSKFLDISENEPMALAVHCKAGLGRTGTLIGLYAMKHYQFPAREFIGWIRLCRPGSILGAQQQFLVDLQADMFQAGAALRCPRRPISPKYIGSTPDPAQQAEKFSLKDRSQAEQYEDIGQGERLCSAKRAGNARAHFGTALPELGALQLVLPTIGKPSAGGAGAVVAGGAPYSKHREKASPDGAKAWKQTQDRKLHQLLSKVIAGVATPGQICRELHNVQGFASRD